MTPERYRQIKSAFALAVDFPPGQREPLLRQLYPSDPDLLLHVLSLFDSDALPATALDKPAVGTQFRLRALSLSYTATPH